MPRQLFAYELVIVQLTTLFLLIVTGLQSPIYPVGLVLRVGGVLLGLGPCILCVLIVGVYCPRCDKVLT